MGVMVRALRGLARETSAPGAADTLNMGFAFHVIRLREGVLLCYSVEGGQSFWLSRLTALVGCVEAGLLVSLLSGLRL